MNWQLYMCKYVSKECEFISCKEQDDNGNDDLQGSHKESRDIVL